MEGNNILLYQAVTSKTIKLWYLEQCSVLVEKQQWATSTLLFIMNA